MSKPAKGRRPWAPPRVVSTSFAAGVEPCPGVCMVCGCTEDRACDGGCSWVDEAQTLCSACADSLALAAVAWLNDRRMSLGLSPRPPAAPPATNGKPTRKGRKS
jgi:hypothetical protein